MKSWKEQLKDVKRVLRDAVQDKEGDEKPSKVDFEPPKSWLSEDVNPSKPVGGSKGGSRSASTSRSGRTETPRQKGASGERNPIPARTSSRRPGPTSSHSSKASNDTDTLTFFCPRVDAGRSLNMPDWANIGECMQHPDNRGGRPMTVRVGVDFGTAFTKVAIRVGADTIPVDWSPVTGDESSTGRFVLPGFVHRTPASEYLWRRGSNHEILGNLKLPIMENANPGECPTATLAFLALVIRYARAYLYRHQKVERILASRTLRWELNIGCPTEPHEQVDVVERFQRIARIVWQLAGTDDLCDPYIEEAWRSNAEDLGLETQPAVVPEFVAQVAGYLRSPQVSEGLHALIDVGAATLDVATFNVVLPRDRDSQPKIPIFFSRVRSLGTHYLNRERHSRLGLEPSWSDAAPVESSADFAARHGKPKSEVDEIDSDFIKRVIECISGVLDSTRTNRRGDPNSASWREGLPIFVTGGGSDCAPYRRAIEEAENHLKRKIGKVNRFRFIEMDPPGTGLDEIGSEIRSRLSVAFGLTEDAENIARVVPHRDIEPITPPQRQRLDHTELYEER